MKIHIVHGVIDRRLLVNSMVAPEVLARSCRTCSTPISTGGTAWWESVSFVSGP